MTQVKALNQFLANLAVWNIKLHNLHWNVQGPFFMPLHNYTEKLYDEAFEKFDEVAELLKMRGEFPLASMKEYLAVATIDELPTGTMACHNVRDILMVDMERLMREAQAIRDGAAQSDDFQVQAMFEEIINGYRKELWMLRAMDKVEGCPL